MKKLFFPLLLGLAAGAGLMWVVLRSHTGAPSVSAATQAEAKPEEAAAGGGPKLTPEQQASSGLATAAPAMMQLVPEIAAYGRVLDLAPFITAVTDLATAQSALALSEKEFTRVRTLHAEGENASTQMVEAADAAAQRDRVAALAARARLVAGWGRTLAEKANLSFLETVLKEGWALVRIDVAAGQNITPTAARVGSVTDESLLTEVELVGAAATADPQLQGSGWLALWKDHPLPPGSMVRATLTLAAAPESALVIPRPSVVRHESSTWVYVQTETGSYERRRVEIIRSLAQGYVIASGVTVNDRIVTVGAQQLLSTELNAANAEEP
jgi:hypothetical protein